MNKFLNKKPTLLRVLLVIKNFPSGLYTLSLTCILTVLVLGHLELNKDENFKWKIIIDLCNATFAGVVFYFITTHLPQSIKKEKTLSLFHNITFNMLSELDEFFISFPEFPNYKRHQQFTDKEILTLLCNIDGLKPVKNDKYIFRSAQEYIQFLVQDVLEKCKLILQFSDILPSESHYLMSMIFNNSIHLQSCSNYKQDDMRYLAMWFLQLRKDLKKLNSVLNKDMHHGINSVNFRNYNKDDSHLTELYSEVSKASKHATSI